MSDNEEEENKLQELQNDITNAVSLAKNVETGNVAGAIKDAVKLAKGKNFKKVIIKKIIKYLTPVIAIILTVSILFGIFSGILNTVLELLSSVVTGISKWAKSVVRYIENDYWIDIDESNTYTDQDGNTYNGTLVDNYIKKLDELGVSLEDLRIIGSESNYNGDVSTLTEEEKKNVEKYISEFVRADIITSHAHTNKTSDNVKPGQENLIDGGIYLYRNNILTNNNKLDFTADEVGEKQIGADNKVRMTYIEKNEFEQILHSGSETAQNGYGGFDDVMNFYSIDFETNELLLVEGNSNITTTGSVTDDTSTVDNYKERRISLDNYISGYSMPFEFLINLCQITQNPEFVYHVALLARKTKIELIVLYNEDTTYSSYTVTETIDEDTIKYENGYSYVGKEDYVGQEYIKYKRTSDNAAFSLMTPIEDTKTELKSEVTIAGLYVEKANAWSFYEQNTYNGVKLQEYNEKCEKTNETIKETAEGCSYDVNIEYSNFANYHKKITYSEDDPDFKVTNSLIEKSKQFLGLLRNETGECYCDDCFENWESAKTCVKQACFDETGINVSYKIPGMSKKETPLNKLTSGLDMLYSLLEKELKTDPSDENYDADADYVSKYNEKMQGIVEHLKYLMTFPENEVGVPDDEEEQEEQEESQEDDNNDVTSNPSMEIVAKEIYNMLINEGYTPEAACGFLGNVHKESWFKLDASNGTHFGLCQWGGGRYENLVKVAQSESKHWYHLDVQKKHIMNELNGGYSGVASKIKNNTDLHSTTEIVCKEYEICGNYDKEVNDRYKKAAYWYAKFTGKSGNDYDDVSVFGTYTSSSGKTYIQYRQGAYPDVQYGKGTVASQGCNVTSVCIILSAYGFDINPSKLLNGGTPNLIGTYTELTDRNLNVKRLGKSDSQINQKIKTHLNNGNPVLIHVYGKKRGGNSGFTKNEHWMVIADIKEKNGVTSAYLIDPAGKSGWYSLDYILQGIQGCGLVSKK